MRTKALALIAIVLASFVLCFACARVAYADTPDAAVMVDAGAPAPDAGAAPLPSDSIDDPVTAPLATYDDLKAAKAVSWTAFFFALLVAITRGAKSATKKWPTLRVVSWLAKNERALLIVGAIGLAAAAGYNALALGGNLMAALVGVGFAVFTFLQAPDKVEA